VIRSDAEIELRDGDLEWNDLLSESTACPSVIADPYEVTNVLFSSGTTGDPKAIPWNHLTPIKCIMDGHFHHDITPGDVVAWPTNIGWMMGPWLIYAALGNRACLALFEGLPIGAAFTRFVRDAGVSMLGVVPSLVRAWRSSDACEGADWAGVETFSSTGEPSNQPDYLWLMSRSGYRAPVIEYCGGTEIGGGYITGTVVQPASPATFTTPSLGLDLVLLDADGRPVADGVDGEVFLVPPSIGLSQSLLNRDHDEVYYDGCPSGPDGQVLRRHGDQMERLAGGWYRAHGRADDTMNLGGIKVSSVELESVLGGHEAVAECAAVAVQPEGVGADQLVVFVVLDEERDPADLRVELGRLLASRLNPLFKIHDVVVVDALPRTASNKLMRRELRARYGEPHTDDG
jgi:acetyl-CoA synthetase